MVYGDGVYRTRSRRIALIGAGAWGRLMINHMLAEQTVKRIAVCDIEKERAKEAASFVISRGIPCDVFYDHRLLLRSFRPDITVIASPDYVRSIHAVDALAAGSHVFTGEAAGRTAEELVEVAAAARTAGRRVQTSLGLRSDPRCIAAIDFLLDGRIGEVKHVQIFCYSSGGPAEQQVAEGIGRGWRWDSARSNGILGSEGTHWLDLISWWRRGEVPRSVVSFGEAVRCTQSRWSTTVPMNAINQVAEYDFSNLRVNWKHRHTPAEESYQTCCGIQFNGRLGTLSYQQGGQWLVKIGRRETSIERIVGEDAGPADPLLRTYTEFVASTNVGRSKSLDIVDANRSAMLAFHAMDSYRNRCRVWPADLGRA